MQNRTAAAIDLDDIGKAEILEPEIGFLRIDQVCGFSFVCQHIHAASIRRLNAAKDVPCGIQAGSIPSLSLSFCKGDSTPLPHHGNAGKSIAAILGRSTQLVDIDRIGFDVERGLLLSRLGIQQTAVLQLTAFIAIVLRSFGFREEIAIQMADRKGKDCLLIIVVSIESGVGIIRSSDVSFCLIDKSKIDK